MHDQRIEGRAALGLKNARDGVVLGRVCAQAIDRLGRKGGETATFQTGGGLGDAFGVGFKQQRQC